MAVAGGSIAVVVVVPLAMRVARGLAAGGPGVGASAAAPWSGSGNLVLFPKMACVQGRSYSVTTGVK